MAKKQATTRNPQDTTLRNVRAVNKRLAHLEAITAKLLAMLTAIDVRVRALEENPLSVAEDGY